MPLPMYGWIYFKKHEVSEKSNQERACLLYIWRGADLLWPNWFNYDDRQSKTGRTFVHFQIRLSVQKGLSLTLSVLEITRIRARSLLLPSKFMISPAFAENDSISCL